MASAQARLRGKRCRRCHVGNVIGLAFMTYLSEYETSIKAGQSGYPGGMTEYHACYALSKLSPPRAARSWRQLVDQLSGTYDRDRQRRRTESAVIHVTAGRTTLCGRDVSRRIDIFEPREAGCRECKPRWELATGRRRP